MSIESDSDRRKFQNYHIQRYNNLSPHLELWNKNSDYSQGKLGTKIPVIINGPESFIVDLKNNCSYGSDCEPDVVKCPIEHVLFIESTEGCFTGDPCVATCFDFEPTTTQKTLEDNAHGRNIMEYRAEYGVFHPHARGEALGDYFGKFKQHRMSKIHVMHPRYHLDAIRWYMGWRFEGSQKPMHPRYHQMGLDDWALTKNPHSKRDMMRRYIFLSVDFLARNPDYDVTEFISDREKEMMIHFYGIPGSHEMALESNMGNPNICSTEEDSSANYWDATTSDRWSQSKINLYTCRHKKVGNNVEKNHVCTTRHQVGGPFDRCRRCGDNCEGEYIARPCARNVWYSKFPEESQYLPRNPIEVNGKVCPFDGYGTEIPDDVNMPNDVCWKSDFLTRNWDTNCKDYTTFKKNYCAGSPGEDLKIWKSSDYVNARYLSDVDRCDPSIEDMDNFCDWVASNNHTADINGVPMVAHCGCKKDSFTKPTGNVDMWIAMHGNRQKLDTFKLFSRNEVLNQHIFSDPDTGERGIDDENDVYGIVKTTDTRCWPSCRHSLGYKENETTDYLDPLEKMDCVWDGCLNQISAENSTLRDVDLSCVRRTNDTSESSSNTPYRQEDPNENNNDNGNTDPKSETNKLAIISTIIGIVLSLIVISVIVFFIMMDNPTNNKNNVLNNVVKNNVI